MTVTRAVAAASKLRDTAGRLFSLLFVFAIYACTSRDRATSPEEVRRLAGSTQARQARQAAEDRLRAVVRAYDEHTPLTLGLVAVNDLCAGGQARELFFPTGDDQYRIRCSMVVTAYYGADPRRIADVLDGVFTAGDHDASETGASGQTIPFEHDHVRRRLVDHYRGLGPNPVGPDASETTQVSASGQTLSWDTVRSSRRRLVEEPRPCTMHDPPVVRCLREPAGQTVAGIRGKHGMVFELELSTVYYYRVSKKGDVQAWG
ncbi:hypothetical protein LO771_00710 [Streptacidiphilus sp. ASG 303]|uniref:hypothetical protein n=1 Tax=Streptacidiphilus sp. ASG 303 TaxID=2896847 RepID=UPI001E3E026D|nr:hypothetical protein [Streptacidiphilus sp. ASG 303]MCD0480972.1 hypothetical protein [Streptacidiphilus sp. ASG 303]